MPRNFTSSRDRAINPSGADRRWAVGVVVMVVALGSAMALGAWFAISFRPETPGSLWAKAHEAARVGDWDRALLTWQALDRTGAADVRSLLEEARAAQALGRIDPTQSALKRACALDPTSAGPWLARLEILRVEDRPIEAQTLAWQAYESVDAEDRVSVLRALTLSMLADVPSDEARTRLQHRRKADPRDLDALAALARRQANEPEPDDPPLPDRVQTLQEALKTDPQHVGVREALVQDLAILGRPDAGRRVLEDWPEGQRDARYHRLKGRWDLDYDGRPDRAVESFLRALEILPHDWKTHYRLSRALYALGQTEASVHAAETVARLREILDPTALGRRLSNNLTHLDDPDSLEDLADLCAALGLDRLARAWRAEAVENDGH